MKVERERDNELGGEGLSQDEVRRPNLYKVACAIANMERCDEIVHTLTLIIKSSLNDPSHRNEDFGLLFSDIFVDSDGTNTQ